MVRRYLAGEKNIEESRSSILIIFGNRGGITAISISEDKEKCDSEVAIRSVDPQPIIHQTFWGMLTLMRRNIAGTNGKVEHVRELQSSMA